ncbi:regulator of nonsense transcripts 3A isoform X6 [Globicephala melas]|uniref:regulator of nonsense transcripts 3A isoform X6 n=1 Tax=Globicephala melas TaxID=9731 RepID=UPI00293D9B3F|nr:regulator of nonsense transcripts 3A isoform X6 [Globicephala melas]
MRSQKEGEGGPGLPVTTRGPSGKEKPSPTESHFRRESQRREPEAPVAWSSGCGGGAVEPREEKRTVLSKVVIRRLPPSLTKEQLEQQLHPLPAHDYFGLFTADLSLYPHLYSRAYINFRNPDDILLFRDRFDGYIFIDSKGLEYPAVVEFAPFQKTAKKKLKKKDTQAGSIEDDPEYKKFLETYCVEEEKTNANPETLLGDIEAKTRELIARRTTPLLEYIKSRKLEKQRIREEKREERRRRELERKRLREEEIRRRREEERRKGRAAEKQQKTAEKEVRRKLLKKSEKGEESSSEKPKERGEEIDTRGGKQELGPSCVVVKPRPLESSLQELREKTDQACSCTSPEVASEPVNVMEDPLRRAVTGGGMRWKIHQGLELRRAKRQRPLPERCRARMPAGPQLLASCEQLWSRLSQVGDAGDKHGCTRRGRPAWGQHCCKPGCPDVASLRDSWWRETIHDFQITCPQKQTHTVWPRSCPPRRPESRAPKAFWIWARLSGHGSRAQPLRGMWDLPGPGHEPMSPASAGGLSTTAPPGKPLANSFGWSSESHRRSGRSW